MRINIKKTKVMRFSKYKGNRITIVMDREQIEQICQFFNFGNIITDNCRFPAEIKRRRAMRKEAVWKRGEVLRKKTQSRSKEVNGEMPHMYHIHGLLVRQKRKTQGI